VNIKQIIQPSRMKRLDKKFGFGAANVWDNIKEKSIANNYRKNIIVGTTSHNWEHIWKKHFQLSKYCKPVQPWVRRQCNIFNFKFSHGRVNFILSGLNADPGNNNYHHLVMLDLGGTTKKFAVSNNYNHN